MINKEKLIRNIKSQIEENQITIKNLEMDHKYLQKLFGTIPKLAKKKNSPTTLNYNYGFFDNFSLYHQPIDKYTPKLGFDLETQKEYVKDLN